MEAELVSELPVGDGWQYEPKWDGFRGVLENFGGELKLWSRKERPLLRYFPELRPLGDLLPPSSALDGEIVIARDGVLEFDLMQMRLHPAESRINKLSGEIPAEFIAFDVLVWDGEPVHERPLAERRAFLEEHAKGFRLSPATQDPEAAGAWLDTFEAAGLDGVIAKRVDASVQAGLAGGRDQGEAVQDGGRRRRRAALEDAALAHRHAAARPLPRRRRARLRWLGRRGREAARRDRRARVPLLEDAPERRFSEPNRWGTGELEEAALRPELVAEVRYDKVQGSRFRHGTRFIRFREDKDPADCTWRELRPPRKPDDPTFESLLAS